MHRRRQSVLGSAPGAILLALSLGAIGLGCPKSARPAPDVTTPEKREAPAGEPPASDPLQPLYAVEQTLRRAIAEGRPPPGPGGPNPMGLARVASDRAVVALQGTDELLLVDERGRERHRVRSAAGARAVAMWGKLALVVGEREGRLLAHDVERDRIGPARSLLDGLGAARAVAVLEGTSDQPACALVVDDFGQHLVSVALGHDRGAAVQRYLTGPRPFEVKAAGRHAVVLSLIDHAAEVLAFDTDCKAKRLARVTHDGPLTAASIKREGPTLVLRVAGVEDRPLDRSGGFFGDVDAATFTYSVPLMGGPLVRGAVAPLGERGVVAPRAIVHDADARWVFSSGSDVAAALPGSSAETGPVHDALRMRAGHLLATSPIMDALVVLAVSPPPTEPSVRWVEVAASGERGTRGPPQVRLGEALARTALMSERPSAVGQHSMASCETCHHELSVDGRTHFTGRSREGDRVHATTRTLFGLLQNRPHFTRALDKTTTKMVENEFKVMAAGTDGHAWFERSLTTSPWMRSFGLDANPRVAGLAQREALMRYLASVAPPRSPRVRGRARFNDLERRGAAAFEQRCVACHAARVLVDDDATEVAATQWEAHLFGSAPSIMWAREGYEQTGIVPYVHERGARPSSLANLWMKRPYFTDGSSGDLKDLLARVRDPQEGFFHHAPPATSGGLAAADQEALLAFLLLL